MSLNHDDLRWLVKADGSRVLQCRRWEYPEGGCELYEPMREVWEDVPEVKEENPAELYPRVWPRGGWRSDAPA